MVGGTGFIGSHVVKHAVSLGWNVSSLSLRSNSRDLAPDVRTITADVTRPLELKECLANGGFEYVVNCGGYIDHTNYFSGGRKLIDAHFDGVLNLLDTLDRHALKAFVNIGSSDEYGNNAAPQVEDQREAPISPYSSAKASLTHLLQMLYRTEVFPATTLRLFLVYGPGQDSRRFLPQIIKGCLDGRAFPTSLGEQLRDFCFVDDVVQAIFSALECEAAAGEVINIGSGKPVAIRETIELVRSIVGSGSPQYGKVAYRTGENMSLYPDISKARSVLQWKPSVDLRTGLVRTIDWYREMA